MNQLKIKNRFYSVFLIVPVLCAVLSKVLYFSAAVTGSDIYFTGAANPLLQALPHICKYAYIFTSQLFVAAAVALSVYAITYFGKKTATYTVFASLGGFIVGEIFSFAYNLIRNSLSSGQLAAAVLASASQLLYTAVILIISVVIGRVFVKKSCLSPLRHRMKAYSPYKAVLIPVALRALWQVCDITFFNVIPFVREYDDIRPNEITSIISDYAYTIGVYFVLTALIALLFVLILKKITGELKPKFNGGLNTKNENA